MMRILQSLLPVLVCSSVPAASAPEPGPAGAARSAVLQEGLDEELLQEVRRSLRHGGVDDARRDVEELLEEEPGNLLLLSLRSRVRFEDGDYEGALEDARVALAGATARGDDLALAPEGVARLARNLATHLVELGDPAGAVQALESVGAALRPREDPLDAWTLGRALSEAGRREEARNAFRGGAATSQAAGWERALARARCQRALGDIRSAAETLVAADRLATEENSGLSEPDVLVELGDLYFEAYGEVNDPVSLSHSPAELYREALEISPRHEGARLGLFELHRFNWMRHRQTPDEILDEVLGERPASLRGLLARVSMSLDNGDLPAARRALKRLERLAPGRRDVRAERAALAWVEHRREDARDLLDRLLEEDPGDSAPELLVGKHLLELYRFAEARPFLERSVERNPRDWRAWTQLGRALANTADEDAAREALAKAVEVADGRKDAWRDNTALVLTRMSESLIEHEERDLTFAWMPDAAPVLEHYLVPFYTEARDELAERYGFTPGPVKIEIFRRWEDFSVRSTGFEGFPALGVCFGPVVTAVSPLAEMRGQFSWARTSFHEFTHVVHLGLSHNRCPRWVTEGLATWEEGERNPAWWRNMRRELLDARANGEILPLRELNQAFRTQRVLFAYYQSGLLCEMLVDEHGFAPMVRLLEAFDSGLDLDGAFEKVFDRSVDEIDAALLEHIDRKLAEIALEPRWGPGPTFRLRFSLARRPPDDPAQRARWAEDWCTVAWGSYWSGKRVDAEEALRLAETVGALPARGEFLRGEIALSRERGAEARAAYERGFQKGGEDFRARMAFGTLLLRDKDVDGALEQFAAAEDDFPGYPEPQLSAELKLADIFESTDETQKAMEARMRWLAYNAGDYDERFRVAAWLDEEGRHEEAARFWREANEVDPFRRVLHERWGKCLDALGRPDEAAREYEVALLVPAELDADALAGYPGWEDVGREVSVLLAAHHVRQARELAESGQDEAALRLVRKALELDGENRDGQHLLEQLDPERPGQEDAPPDLPAEESGTDG